jgi:UDP-N-acetylglucosamine diphosphorylase/glucosamine-1-phosphate N-acetyltransferase
MAMLSRGLAFIVLAAGLGKRMKSDKAKVLHELLGKPMVHYVVETATEFAGRNVYVVVGYQSEIVQSSIERKYDVQYVFQKNQMGTGHAVSCVLPYLDAQIRHVVILCGDTPLISLSTIELLINTHFISKNDLTVLAVKMENPTGYGRVLLSEDQHVEGIVEETDATECQRNIKIINSGIYCVEKQFLVDAIGSLTTHNAQHEMYLTDIVGNGYRMNKKIAAVIGLDTLEMIGINSQQDLITAEEEMWLRLSKNLDFRNSP